MTTIVRRTLRELGELPGDFGRLTSRLPCTQSQLERNFRQIEQDLEALANIVIPDQYGTAAIGIDAIVLTGTATSDWTDASPPYVMVDGTVTVRLPRTRSGDPNVWIGDPVAYVEDEEGDYYAVSDYMDDKIGTMKFWAGDAGSIPNGWAVMNGGQGGSGINLLNFMISMVAADPGQQQDEERTGQGATTGSVIVSVLPGGGEVPVTFTDQFCAPYYGDTKDSPSNITLSPYAGNTEPRDLELSMTAIATNTDFRSFEITVTEPGGPESTEEGYGDIEVESTYMTTSIETVVITMVSSGLHSHNTGVNTANDYADGSEAAVLSIPVSTGLTGGHTHGIDCDAHGHTIAGDFTAYDNGHTHGIEPHVHPLDPPSHQHAITEHIHPLTGLTGEHYHGMTHTHAVIDAQHKHEMSHTHELYLSAYVNTEHSHGTDEQLVPGIHDHSPGRPTCIGMIPIERVA